MRMRHFCKRHIEKALVLAVIIGLGSISRLHAGQSVYNSQLANETGLAYNNTYYLNLNNYKADSISFQVVYGSATFASKTFTDGTQSTGSITIVSTVPLAGLQGTNSLTVLSTNSLTAATITIGGKVLTEGIHWSQDSVSTNTVATTIKNAINTFATQFTATIGGQTNKVTITCGSSGTWCNNQGLVVSVSSITAGAATFTGGVDNAYLAINGVPLVQGVDWNTGASSAAVANAIAVAINANASLSTTVTSTAPLSCVVAPKNCGIVTSTSVSVGLGTNYLMFSSTQAAMKLGNVASTDSVGHGTSTYVGGTDSGYSLNSGTITVTSHGFTKALGVLYSTGVVTIAGLTNQTTYFVIPITANTFMLASTSLKAQAGTADIVATSSSAQTTAHTFTLAPLAISGTASVAYDVTNDGTNWTRLTSPAAFNLGYVNPSTSTVVDIGSINYSQIRVNVTAPTQGGIILQVTPNAKTNK